MIAGAKLIILESDPRVAPGLAAEIGERGKLVSDGTVLVKYDTGDTDWRVLGGAPGAIGTFTPTAIPFAGADGFLTEDPTKLVYVDSGDTVIVGSTTFASNPFPVRLALVGGATFSQLLDCYAATSTSGPGQLFRRGDGTEASPSAVGNSYTLGAIGAKGHTGSSFPTLAPVQINFITSEAHSDTNNGARIDFIVTRAGTASSARFTSIRLRDDGDLGIQNIGSGLRVAEGSNAKMGAVALVLGTATVSTTAVSANSRIFLTHQDNGGVVGFVTVSARVAGTSFTITSSSALDTSTVAWIIVDPA